MSRFVLVFIAVIFSLNLFFLDFFFFSRRQSSVATRSDAPACDESCRQQVAAILESKLKISPSPSAAVSPLPTAVPRQTTRQVRTIQYVPVTGSGSTLNNSWVDLPGTEFYLSTNDYPNLSESYFEANIRLQNGNGRCFVRLFDVTAGIEVWGSEVASVSQNFSSVSSGRLTIRPGTRLYRVQAKSLTADTCVFNSGRLKLILNSSAP